MVHPSVNSCVLNPGMDIRVLFWIIEMGGRFNRVRI